MTELDPVLDLSAPNATIKKWAQLGTLEFKLRHSSIPGLSISSFDSSKSLKWSLICIRLYGVVRLGWGSSPFSTQKKIYQHFNLKDIPPINVVFKKLSSKNIFLSRFVIIFVFFNVFFSVYQTICWLKAKIVSV